MRPRILVVSYHAANGLTPRGARTQAVVAALSSRADVHLIGGPSLAGPRPWWHRARDRALAEVGSRWLIDPIEPWSWKTFGHRAPEADLALLIGYPFSPLVLAASSLRHHAIPYVVDISDPWALRPANGVPQTWRNRRSAAYEHRLWAGAAAGIVTTDGQARDVLRRVPGLNVLVRPNGYAEVGAVTAASRRTPKNELHIGHFGALYTPRIDVSGFLRRLATSDRWGRVAVHQYGPDHQDVLRKVSDVVTVHVRDPIPWRDVIRLSATELDIALVVGNQDTRQLPSKAIEYSTLPVPRLALTSGRAGDALADYVGGKRGWLTLSIEDADPVPRLFEHVGRGWLPEDLAPSRNESWGHVAEELATFVLGQGPSGV